MTWLSFSSKNLSEFMLPFQSLRHELDGVIFYLITKLFDFANLATTNIWNIGKFIIFIVNSILLYAIAKRLLHKKSILPQTIAIAYLVSPVVNNLCLSILNRHFYIALFFISILLSIESVTKKEFRPFYYLSSLLFYVVAIFGLETFVFIDIARPAIIFYIFFYKNKENFSTAFKKSIFYWFIFVIIGVSLLTYRIGLFVPRTGPYAHTYAFKSLSAIQYIMHIIKAYRDSLYCLFLSNLFYFLKRALILLKDGFNVMLSLIAAAFAALVIFKEWQIAPKKEEEISLIAKEVKITAVFGAFLIFFGLLPYTIVGLGAGFGTGTRHALLANIGVSVFIPSILLFLYYSGFIKKQFYYILFSVFVFLGVFQCNYVIKAYSSDWQQQRSFWWQLIWRVPDIKGNVFLIFDMSRQEYDYLGDWRAASTFSAPLNIIYAKSRDKNEMDKHFSETIGSVFGQEDVSLKVNYLANRDEDEAYYNFYKGAYKYYPKNIIIASYHRGYLYLNGEIDQSKTSNILNIAPVVLMSSDKQILTHKADNLVFPFRWIIGPEPKKTNERTPLDKFKDAIFRRTLNKDWRYYLQTAKVADGNKDFRAVVGLYNEAQGLGVVPELPEAAPLFIIKAFYVVGDIAKANSLFWEWALSSEGDYKKALGLLESVKSVNNNPSITSAIEKKIQDIWRHNL